MNKLLFHPFDDPFAIYTFLRAEEPDKTLVPSVDIEVVTVIEVRLLQLENALLPIVFTLIGILIELSDEHPSKEEALILVILPGSVIDFSDVHPLKEEAPIVTIDVGNVTLDNLEQLAKVELPTEVIPFAIINFEIVVLLLKTVLY